MHHTLLLKSFFISCMFVTFSPFPRLSASSDLCLDIIPKTSVLSQSGKLLLTIEHPNKNIYIKPRAEYGLPNFIGTNQGWSETTESVPMTLYNLDTNKTQVWFLLQNTKTGKVYETSKITVYSRNQLEKYRQNLNQNIKSVSRNRVLK